MFRENMALAVIAEAKKNFPIDALDAAVKATAHAASVLVIQAANGNCRMDESFSASAHTQLRETWRKNAATELEREECAHFIRWASRAFVALALPPKAKAAA